MKKSKLIISLAIVMLASTMAIARALKKDTFIVFYLNHENQCQSVWSDYSCSSLGLGCQMLISGMGTPVQMYADFLCILPLKESD